MHCSQSPVDVQLLLPLNRGQHPFFLFNYNVSLNMKSVLHSLCYQTSPVTSLNRLVNVWVEIRVH